MLQRTGDGTGEFLEDGEHTGCWNGPAQEKRYVAPPPPNRLDTGDEQLVRLLWRKEQSASLSTVDRTLKLTEQLRYNYEKNPLTQIRCIKDHEDEQNEDWRRT